jgi:uncharacterized protein (TIGR04222 family)
MPVVASILNEWLDLPGPQFLLLFAVLAIASLMIGVAIRLALAGPYAPYDQRLGELTPHELAAIGRGRWGVFAAGLVTLLKGGHVTLERDRRWRRGEPIGPSSVAVSSDPRTLLFLRALYEKLPAEGTFTMERALPAASDVADEVVDTAVRHGLRQGVARAALSGFLGFLPTLAVIALGVAKVIVGLQRNRPVVFLLIGLALLIVMGLLVVRIGRGRTIAGWRTLRALRAEREPLRVAAASRAERLSTGDLAWAVSLYGVGVLQGTVWADAVSATKPPRPSVTDGGNSSSGCGTGSGGSCGGGCGGGGCGGCGS